MIRTKAFSVVAIAVATAVTGFILLADDNSGNSNWPQWGQNAQHQGFVNAQGQAIQSQLADIVYDPLVPEEQAFTGGELLAHYQVPLLDGQDVFMAFKSGDYSNPFNSQVWHEKRLHWEGGQLVETSLPIGNLSQSIFPGDGNPYSTPYWPMVRSTFPAPAARSTS